MKYKILVVDDDKELVKMLCSYFNMKQYLSQAFRISET